MKFLVTAAAFLASTVCATRTIVISDTIIRDYRGIRVISFSLPTLHEKVYAAGHDLDAKRLPVPHLDYFWRATGGDERFLITLYESNKTDAKRVSARIPVKCQLGGNGPDDFVCLQNGKCSVKL